MFSSRSWNTRNQSALLPGSLVKRWNGTLGSFEVVFPPVADLGGGQGGQGPPKILSAILLFTSNPSHSHIWLATRLA